MKAVVLVTGGSGLLGLTWAICRRACDQVVLAVHVRRVRLSGVTARRTDLASVDDICRAIDEHNVGLVVHSAGLTNVEACEQDPALAQHVNVALSRNVATACAQAGVQLVHISTDQMFGDATGLIGEDCPVSPVNTYGRTKAEAEQQVLNAHPNALIARTNFYGWGPAYRPSFSDVILSALRAGEPLYLFDDVFYTPILMDCLVRAVHDLVDRNAKGIFHVTSDERLSKNEFGIRIAEIFGLDANLIRNDSIVERAGLTRRPRNMALSNEKARALLGRQLGGVTAHLEQLREQEHAGRPAELPAS